MITITFAGDEAGDVSFNFEKGASRYFVMAVIATPEPQKLRQTLDDVRQASGLPAAYEFSFHALASAPLRQRIFQALQKADYKAWALVVDKTTLKEPFISVRRLDFYLFFRIGPAIKAVFELGYEPKEELFHEVTADQYEQLEKEGEDIISKVWYTILPEDQKYEK